MTTLHYSPDHTWARLDADGLVTVGITLFAAAELGDVVYVQLPKLGRQVKAAEAAAVVESVKSASDVKMPVAGEVVAVNDALMDTPESVNASPEDEAWFLKLKVADASVLQGLLDGPAYQALVSGG